MGKKCKNIIIITTIMAIIITISACIIVRKSDQKGDVVAVISPDDILSTKTNTNTSGAILMAREEPDISENVLPTISFNTEL